MPYYSNHAFGLKREQYDMVALRRILFMPLSFYHPQGHCSTDERFQIERSVLTSGILDQFNLNSYINTWSHANDKDKNDFADSDLNAMTLAAILITARPGLALNYQELKNNPNLCEIIISNYTETEKDKRQSLALKQKIASDLFKYFSLDMDSCKNAPSFMEYIIINLSLPAIKEIFKTDNTVNYKFFFGFRDTGGRNILNYLFEYHDDLALFKDLLSSEYMMYLDNFKIFIQPQKNGYIKCLQEFFLGHKHKNLVSILMENKFISYSTKILFINELILYGLSKKKYAISKDILQSLHKKDCMIKAR